MGEKGTCLQLVPRFVSYFSGLRPKTKFPREMGSTSGFLVLSPRNGSLVTAFCSPSPGRGSPSSPPTSLGLPEAQTSWAPEANGAESRLLLQGQQGKQPSPDLGILGGRQNAQGGMGPWDKGPDRQLWGRHRCSKDRLHLAGRQESQRGDSAAQSTRRQ